MRQKVLNAKIKIFAFTVFPLTLSSNKMRTNKSKSWWLNYPLKRKKTKDEKYAMA